MMKRVEQGRERGSAHQACGDEVRAWQSLQIGAVRCGVVQIEQQILKELNLLSQTLHRAAAAMRVCVRVCVCVCVCTCVRVCVCVLRVRRS